MTLALAVMEGSEARVGGGANVRVMSSGSRMGELAVVVYARHPDRRSPATNAERDREPRAPTDLASAQPPEPPDDEKGDEEEEVVVDDRTGEPLVPGVPTS
jgi:hypothetical protein